MNDYQLKPIGISDVSGKRVHKHVQDGHLSDNDFQNRPTNQMFDDVIKPLEKNVNFKNESGSKDLLDKLKNFQSSSNRNIGQYMGFSKNEAVLLNKYVVTKENNIFSKVLLSTAKEVIKNDQHFNRLIELTSVSLKNEGYAMKKINLNEKDTGNKYDVYLFEKTDKNGKKHELCLQYSSEYGILNVGIPVQPIKDKVYYYNHSANFDTAVNKDSIRDDGYFLKSIMDKHIHNEKLNFNADQGTIWDLTYEAKKPD